MRQAGRLSDEISEASAARRAQCEQVAELRGEVAAERDAYEAMRLEHAAATENSSLLRGMARSEEAAARSLREEARKAAPAPEEGGCWERRGGQATPPARF